MHKPTSHVLKPQVEITPPVDPPIGFREHQRPLSPVCCDMLYDSCIKFNTSLPVELVMIDMQETGESGAKTQVNFPLQPEPLQEPGDCAWDERMPLVLLCRDQCLAPEILM